VLPSPMFLFMGEGLVKAAQVLKVPVIYPFEELTEAGGLLSYAAPVADSYRRAAYYVDRILRGAKPAELPIEQPTRLALAINLKSAGMQGIRIPQELLLRADRVIE
jgi:putative tryptophan/tyrosine transport system substrate-binding protein